MLLREGADFLVDRRLPDCPTDAVADAEEVAHDEHREEVPGAAHGRRHHADEADGRQQDPATAVAIGEEASDPARDRPGHGCARDQEPHLPSREMKFGHDQREDQADAETIEADTPPEEREQHDDRELVTGGLTGRHHASSHSANPWPRARRIASSLDYRAGASLGSPRPHPRRAFSP